MDVGVGADGKGVGSCEGGEGVEGCGWVEGGGGFGGHFLFWLGGCVGRWGGMGGFGGLESLVCEWLNRSTFLFE